MKLKLIALAVTAAFMAEVRGLYAFSARGAHGVNRFGEDTSANSGFTGCVGKAGLTVATTTTKIKLSAPNGVGTDYAIHGIGYEKADTDNITVGAISGDTYRTQAALTKCLYLVQADSAGTITVRQGAEALTTDMTKGKAIQWPTPSPDCCPIAGFKVVLANAATFLPGTTALDATDVTMTYYDFIGGMPSRPQTS